MIGGLFLAHLVGDYLIQSDWMANEKTKRWLPAVLHGATYTLPFLVVTQSLLSLALIAGSHVVIDRYRLARYVVWVSNLASPREWRHPWAECKATGFHQDRPAWLAVWLLFIIDNTIHMLFNVAAVLWFG